MKSRRALVFLCICSPQALALDHWSEQVGPSLVCGLDVVLLDLKRDQLKPFPPMQYEKN